MILLPSVSFFKVLHDYEHVFFSQTEFSSVLYNQI